MQEFFEEMSYIFSDMGGVAGGILALLLFLMIITLLKMFISVAFSDELLVITGRKKKHSGREFGFSVERGRAYRIPYLQRVEKLDLDVLPINVRVVDVNSANGITVGADATACVCIDDNDEGMVYSAVERLMGKTRNQIHEQIQQTLIGNFRGALNKATPLEAIGMADAFSDLDKDISEEGDRAHFRQELLTDINNDLSSFGMKVVSVSFQKIWDNSDYIANLAQRTLAEKRQDVEIEEASLKSDAEKAESDSQRRISVATSRADQKIIEAKKKLEVFRREASAKIHQAELETENKISEETSRGAVKVNESMVKLQELQNKSDVTIKAEAEMKASEIIAAGEQQAVNIIESTRNDILRQKVELIQKAKETGRLVLFVQQQLPALFEAYKKSAEGTAIDQLVIMDDEKGISGAANRGPESFVKFLQYLEQGFGIDLKEIISNKGSAA